MTEITLEQSTSTPWKALRIGLISLAFVALAITNALTLTNDEFHSKAYRWLETIVRSVSDGSILGNSPTEVRKYDVAVATQGLISEKNHLTRHALELTSDAVAIAAEIKAIKIEKAAIEGTAKLWEKRHQQVEDTLLKNRSSTQKLTKSVIQRLARNTSRNVTGLFGKSVPYLGIAVTLAMTGIDVVDACDTVREMNQLSKSMDLPVEDDSSVCGVRIPSQETVISEVSKNWKSSYLAASDVLNQAGKQIPAPPTTDEFVRQASSFWLSMASSASLTRR